VVAFRDAMLREHGADHIDLLFSNAGIGGGGSFLLDDRADWDKTFGVCWFGVYYCARAFLPLLVASAEGYIVHISSVNGFWRRSAPGFPIRLQHREVRGQGLHRGAAQRSQKLRAPREGGGGDAGHIGTRSPSTAGSCSASRAPRTCQPMSWRISDPGWSGRESPPRRSPTSSSRA